MNLSNRDLVLLMLALDNTSHELQEECTATGEPRLGQQAEDMDTLWERCREELDYRTTTAHLETLADKLAEG